MLNIGWINNNLKDDIENNDNDLIVDNKEKNTKIGSGSFLSSRRLSRKSSRIQKKSHQRKETIDIKNVNQNNEMDDIHSLQYFIKTCANGCINLSNNAIVLHYISHLQITNHMNKFITEKEDSKQSINFSNHILKRKSTKRHSLSDFEDFNSNLFQNMTIKDQINVYEYLFKTNLSNNVEDNIEKNGKIENDTIIEESSTNHVSIGSHMDNIKHEDVNSNHRLTNSVSTSELQNNKYSSNNENSRTRKESIVNQAQSLLLHGSSNFLEKFNHHISSKQSSSLPQNTKLNLKNDTEEVMGYHNVLESVKSESKKIRNEHERLDSIFKKSINDFRKKNNFMYPWMKDNRTVYTKKRSNSMNDVFSLKKNSSSQIALSNGNISSSVDMFTNFNQESSITNVQSHQNPTSERALMILTLDDCGNPMKYILKGEPSNKESNFKWVYKLQKTIMDQPFEEFKSKKTKKELQEEKKTNFKEFDIQKNVNSMKSSFRDKLKHSILGLNPQKSHSRRSSLFSSPDVKHEKKEKLNNRNHSKSFQLEQNHMLEVPKPPLLNLFVGNCFTIDNSDGNGSERLKFILNRERTIWNEQYKGTWRSLQYSPKRIILNGNGKPFSNQNFILNFPVQIMGGEGKACISYDNEEPIFTVGSYNIRISNLSVKYKAFNESFAVYFSSGSSAHIENCSISSDGGGIYVDSCSDCHISECLISNCTIGVKVEDNSHVTCERCIITGNTQGIFFKEESSIKLGENEINSNRIGIVFNGKNSTNNLMTNNHLSRNTFKDVVGNIELNEKDGNIIQPATPRYSIEDTIENSNNLNSKVSVGNDNSSSNTMSYYDDYILNSSNDKRLSFEELITQQANYREIYDLENENDGKSRDEDSFGLYSDTFDPFGITGSSSENLIEYKNTHSIQISSPRDHSISVSPISSWGTPQGFNTSEKI